MRKYYKTLVKEIFSKTGNLERPADGLRYEIWRRQWEIYDLTGNRTEAKKISICVTELAQQNKNYTAEACFYSSAALVNIAEFKEALGAAQKGLQVAQKGGDPRKTIQLMAQCGKCCYQLGDFPGSLFHWQNLYDSASLTGEKDMRATALNSIGLIYWKTSRYQEALDVLSKAEEAYQHQQNLRSSALAMQSRGNVLLGLDRTEQALEVYTKSQKLAQQIGDLSLQSALLNNIGGIFFRHGHQTKAREAFEKGLKIDRMLGNLSGQAKKLNNLAILLATLGKSQLAMEYAIKALELDTSTGNLDGQMAKMGNISSLWLEMGDVEKAIIYIDQGIKLSQKLGSQAFLGQFLGLKVKIELKIGHPEEAIKFGEEALKINRQIGNQSYQVNALINMHEVYLSLGKPKTALECSAQALELVKDTDLFEVEKEAVYFAHYQSLIANGQAAESLTFLESAYREVLLQAEGIEDREGREYFLHGEPQHRQILQEWEKAGSQK